MNPRLRAAMHSGTRREHAEGQHRARHQEGRRRRRRELRGDPLRGLRPRRRRRHRRGADRQPQPHRLQRALRPSPRAAATSAKPARCRSCSTASARSNTTPRPATADEMLEAAIEAGADDVESGEDGHEIYAAPEILREVAKALEAKFGEPRKATAHLEAAEHRRRSTTRTARSCCKLIETLERARRRAERLRQFRGLRRARRKMSA